MLDHWRGLSAAATAIGLIAFGTLFLALVYGNMAEGPSLKAEALDEKTAINDTTAASTTQPKTVSDYGNSESQLLGRLIWLDPVDEPYANGAYRIENGKVFFVNDGIAQPGAQTAVEMSGADAATFRVLFLEGSNYQLWYPYAIDSTHAFVGSRHLAGGDPKTFSPLCSLQCSRYVKDGRHVWYIPVEFNFSDGTEQDILGMPRMIDADAESFFSTCLDNGGGCPDGDAKDNVRRYLRGEPI